MNQRENGPRPRSNWRAAPADRAEDAAYIFGFDLVRHCREEALKRLPREASSEIREAVEAAVDTALHNVCDLLEGYWRTMSGAETVTYSLVVNVLNDKGETVESIPISPGLVDLPIGYWKWRDGEFR